MEDSCRHEKVPIEEMEGRHISGRVRAEPGTHRERIGIIAWAQGVYGRDAHPQTAQAVECARRAVELRPGVIAVMDSAEHLASVATELGLVQLSRLEMPR